MERVYRLVSPGRTPLFGTLSDRADEAIRRADMVATRRQLDWVPEVPLDEGLARMIEWFPRTRELHSGVAIRFTWTGGSTHLETWFRRH